MTSLTEDHQERLGALFEALYIVSAKLAENGAPEEALEASWEKVVEGFVADRAVLFFVRGHSLHVALHKGLNDEQITALQEGGSAKGVSGKVIGWVLENKKTLLIEHPMFVRRIVGAKTNAFSGEASNSSVLCAPILDAFSESVYAIIYFRNTGFSIPKAYRPADQKALESYVAVIQAIIAHHRHATAYTGLTFDEAMRVAAANIIQDRIHACGGNHTQAMEELGMKRQRFYRFINLEKNPPDPAKEQRFRAGNKTS